MILSVFLTCSFLLAPLTWCAQGPTPRTQAEILGIYELFRSSDNDMLKVVLADERLFDDCMKNERVAISIRLFHEAFIMKRGIIHDLPGRNIEEVASAYFTDHIMSQPVAVKQLIRFYLNCSKEEQQEINAYFKTRESWITGVRMFGHLKQIAKLVGETLVNGRVPFHRLVDVGVRLKAPFGYFHDSIPSLLCSLFSHSWKMEPLHNQEAIMSVAKTSTNFWVNIDQLISTVLEPKEVDVFCLVVKFLSEQKQEDRAFQINHINLPPKTEIEFYTETIRQNCWSLLSMFLAKKLKPSIYNVIREINPMHFPIILPSDLNKPINMATLHMIRHMARFLDGKECPALSEYLEGFLNCKREESAICDGMATDGVVLPINHLPDDVLSQIIYESIESLAFSELVLKRVCKRWV